MTRSIAICLIMSWSIFRTWNYPQTFHLGTQTTKRWDCWSCLVRFSHSSYFQFNFHDKAATREKIRIFTISEKIRTSFLSPWIFSSLENIHIFLHSPRHRSTHVQHVPITMITKLCKRKQTCCKVTYCPLVPAWATTIHKFQGFEAGFDKNDQFNQLIVDPGDLTTELLNPGTLYVALSRAKSIGTITPNELHPKDSALFWTGSGMYLNRVLNITQKKGDHGNMINCLKVDQRQQWIDHLFERNRITTTKQYNPKQMQKIECNLPKK